MPGTENWELNQTESAHTEHSLLEEIELATSNYKAVKSVIMRYTQKALEAHQKSDSLIALK